MAHFCLENDIHNILRLDMPITTPPMARWQWKASTSNSTNPNSLSPNKSVNRSVSLSKTPSKTPGKNSKTQNTPTAGGDRFIPTRNNKQLDVASFLISKANEPVEETPSLATNQKAWSVTLNGYDIEEAKILHFGGNPLNAPEGYQNNTTPASVKKSRCISSVTEQILHAPGFRNDFYLNLMDWGRQNLLAIGLAHRVFLWDAAVEDIILLKKMEDENNFICSVSWSKDGNFLAVGTSDCKVELWDVQCQKRLRSMDGHSARVGCLSWNHHILSSGSRSGMIHQHDVRVADHHIDTYGGHSGEVCGLSWSPDGQYLASGGNDDTVFIWPMTTGSGNQVVRALTEHQGAVKALAWCPWQPNILASGGGIGDHHIRIWNANSGSCISSLDTPSQISSLVFSPNYKELVSGHGFGHDKVIIWKYPSLTKVAELEGHEDRILNLALSPDGSTVASIAADETVRLWKCFEKDPVKKPKPTSSIIQQHIR
ncbi:cell division cycle protein 20 homolog [Misgurnus anguillicaudatus]|uniref:cell division cycle protein 20 homolog n=1 Tax=Misgurnus anguillicaudatus TaxID=75329 RepID=UPI002435A738|nr:cell division cycle protein 20 homolog [Misgurnus anguillicaudatus]